MATRKPRRTARTTEPSAPESKALPIRSPREIWLANPHARTLADFQQLLNDLAKPTIKVLDELFQTVFGAAARPENRMSISADQRLAVYQMLTTLWPKVNGEKSAAAVAKREKDAADAGQTPSTKRKRQEVEPIDKLNMVINGLATHTYRFHDARPASGQVCVVEPEVRAPYLFGASITMGDARISPTYTSSAFEHDKAALIEAEMLVDGQPFSLAMDLAQGGTAAESLLTDLGFSGVQRPQVRVVPPSGNGTVLIVQDEDGKDLHLVPNVSVNVDRALSTARYLPGKRNTLARRSRLYLVGGTQRQNAGMLNTMLSHPMILQSLPWRADQEVEDAMRTLMSPRRPMANNVHLNAKTVADHPMLRLRGGPKVEERARRTLESLVERLLRPVLNVHEVLRNGRLSTTSIARVQNAKLSPNEWRRLMLGTPTSQDMAVIAGQIASQIWALLGRLPQAFEYEWTVREVIRLLEALIPRQPLL